MDFFSVRWDSLLTPLFRSPVIRLSEGDGYHAVCEDLRDFRRNGRAALAGKIVVWLHGASIGEVKCLLPIAKNLLADGDCEGAFFTYTSPDGLAEINRSLSKHRMSVVTCPLLKAGVRDLETCLHRARLRLCIIAEKRTFGRA